MLFISLLSRESKSLVKKHFPKLSLVAQASKSSYLGVWGRIDPKYKKSLFGLWDEFETSWDNDVKPCLRRKREKKVEDTVQCIWMLALHVWGPESHPQYHHGKMKLFAALQAVIYSFKFMCVGVLPAHIYEHHIYAVEEGWMPQDWSYR